MKSFDEDSWASLHNAMLTPYVSCQRALSVRSAKRLLSAEQRPQFDIRRAAFKRFHIHSVALNKRQQQYNNTMA